MLTVTTKGNNKGINEDDAVNGDDDGEDGTAAGTEEMTLR